MSGIFGLYYRNQQMVERETLYNMGESMLHRGPDGIDAWCENNIGIGNCKFHTTPESVGETLPYIDNETGLVITVDARIDAREELAKKLGIYERLKDGISDSHLILAAYSKWQTKCVHHLLGDFTFLIWDKEKQQLFCARDHLGVKPFYYHISDHVFVVGSEVGAILKVPQVPRRINEARIADYLVNQLERIDKTSTFYESIFRLPPAHTMLISKEKKLVEKYWQLDSESEIRYQSDDEYIETFHEIFKESVRDRLRCNGQATSMLSGGVDSSYVVATARQLMKDSGSILPTYSGISEDDRNCRETHFIKLVLAQGGFDATTVRPSDVFDYEKKLFSVESPIEELFDAAMTAPMLFYLMARDRGQRVMLDGVEGDFVHSLTASYPANLFRRGQYIRAISESFDIWRHTYGKQISLKSTLRRTVGPAVIPEYLRQWKRRFSTKLILDHTLEQSWINRDFAKSVDIESRLACLRAQTNFKPQSNLRENQVQNIMHPSLTVGLERYNRVAANCSIESRHPLLDKRLVEFSVSLPWEQKVRHGWSKYQIRCAGGSILPNEVVWRRGYYGICWSFTSALIHKRAAWMVERVCEQQALLRRYVEPNILNSIIKNSEIVAFSDQEVSFWYIFRLANWLEYNMRNELDN